MARFADEFGYTPATFWALTMAEANALADHLDQGDGGGILAPTG